MARRLGWVACAAAAFALALGCAGAGAGEGEGMDRERAETAFETAARETGAAYIAARVEIVAMGAAAAPTIAARRAAEAGDPGRALTAEILAGWLDAREAFETCGRYVKGDLPFDKPITGKFTPMQRSKAIQPLGKTVTARLLEMVLKSGEAREGEARAAAFAALGALGDERAVAPLLALLRGEREPLELRTSAAATLGQLGDRRATDPLLDLLRDAKTPEALRCAAAGALGALKAAGARPTLEGLLLERRTSTDLRRAALRGLAVLGDPASSDALRETLRSAGDDLVLLQSAIDALGKFGDPASAGALAEVEKTHPDRFVRQAAGDARLAVEERGK